MATKAGNMGMDASGPSLVALIASSPDVASATPVIDQLKISRRPDCKISLHCLKQVVNKNLFQSLSGAIKDVHEHVTLFRNIDGGSIGRVLPKCLSQWTSEKVKAQGVNVLPKANVEGAILEDCKVALTLNDGQKAGDVAFVCDIKLGCRRMEHHHFAVVSGRLLERTILARKHG
ncbi:hypothetical protein DAPPUDRAFT_120393 [Daphnia pulex]|uniref:Uncharacterized protein n=1 Tax=Daphnia pulex TaxID=6669 RepID=E9I186_DAPPU|nr:hypothetical protein DAPPUDRAFT_120393 [Daphnia pulex]|eukprot:EFX62244.1 hypothetical protein DAPPUDRAFT_120393 [Daphnia pulex]